MTEFGWDAGTLRMIGAASACAVGAWLGMTLILAGGYHFLGGFPWPMFAWGQAKIDGGSDQFGAAMMPFIILSLAATIMARIGLHRTALRSLLGGWCGGLVTAAILIARWHGREPMSLTDPPSTWLAGIAVGIIAGIGLGVIGLRRAALPR